MFRRVSISTKITGLVILIVLGTIFAISYISYNVNRSSVLDRYNENLELIALNRSNYIHSYFNNITNTMKFLQVSELIHHNLQDAQSIFITDSLMYPSEYNTVEYLEKVKKQYNYNDIYLLSFDGEILKSTNPEKLKFQIFDADFLIKSSSEIYFSLYQQEKRSIYAGAPLTHDDGTRSILAIELNVSDLMANIGNASGLGETGECLIARQVGEHVQYQIPFRGDLLIPSRIPFDSTNNAKPIKEALLGKSGSGISTDYKGAETLAIWRFIPNINWGFVVKIDYTELYQKSNLDLSKYIIYGGLIWVIGIFLSILFSQFLIKPIIKLKSVIRLLNQGILPQKTNVESKDEIGEMATSINGLVDTLKSNAEFAQNIGKGNLNVDFQPQSEQDTLGLSLLDMRNNLIETEKRDEERNWIITGMAELSAILRMHDNLESLGSDVVKYMVNRIGAIQGALYITVNDEEKEKTVELRSLYAYNRKKYNEQIFSFGQGLIGQAVAEKTKILRTEVPPNYMSISSGILGEQQPNCILIVPLITEEEVYGVLEFAGLEKFSDSQTRFVDQVGVSLARTVFNIKVNERTRRLLTESRKMSAELQEKQESLRQNAEEMQATQEELEKSNKLLNEQMEEVSRTQKRMQLLLENASEVITIYEEDQTVRYISPSVLPILGYSQKEMMGNSDLDKVHETMQSEFQNMFHKLMESPSEQVTAQYMYKAKSGEYIWLESTGTNFMSNPAIHGIIVNSSDITERRRAEQEQRMRSKMQALSENSPDLITRLEDNKLSYINPIIEELTGQKPVKYLEKNVDEIELDPIIIEKWLEIVEEVNESNHKVSTEMNFPTLDGQKIMQVNAIPEFDEAENLESVLVVSHDITTRKQQETEIQHQNKKIADSINYAKRIQNAILPNNNVISKVLPNSFILYKPKDIVSGDFPWFAHVGKYIFMSAVDCTGHGVPGALLSLIGYFLLNEIVRSRKVLDPGTILDQLDEGVTSTLKQDQADNSAKDGMDIALCRIDPTTNEVVYAGAHRPLYVMKNGEMVEIKGNKFAIGGGIYKNQTNFTSHIVKLEPGDSFYFCSDGFPDQFGGPDIKKYGPRRTRELIAENHTLHMDDACKVFDATWTEWMGDEKQMDDVLLIGIKF